MSESESETPQPSRNVQFSGSAYGAVLGEHAHVEQHFHAAKVALPTPREAPAPPPTFTAGKDVVERVVHLLRADDGEPITVLCGMGGVGKTTLAAACATSSEVEARFPDGTFWVELPSADPGDTLARIAQAYGQDVRALSGEPARAAAVRSVLATKRALFVLDDASRAEQVEPLLPKTRGCAVLVTTRDERLANDLSAEVVSVESLAKDDALRLWRKLVGDEAGTAAAAASPSLAELLELLGGLPLAISLAGKRARKDARRGAPPLAEYIEELRRPGDLFGVESRYERVGAAFRASYERVLNDDSRRLFRSLAVLSEAESDLPAIAAVWGLDEKTAKKRLDALVDLWLASIAEGGRCRLHPLLRAFATHLLGADPEDARRELHARAADHFFAIAARPEHAPDSVETLDAAVSSYVHAKAARDKERSDRVVPEVRGIHVARTLIHLGRTRSLVRIREADLAAAADERAAPRAWARYWLSDALQHDGQRDRCERELRTCLEEAQTAGGQRPLLVRRAAFLLGHLLRDRGAFGDAAKSYEEAMKADCELSGKDVDPLALLQIGDCRFREGDVSAAQAAFQSVLDTYEDPTGTQRVSFMHVRAAVRLAVVFVSTAPGEALRHLDFAASQDPVIAGNGAGSSLFGDTEGVTYMAQIAGLYADLSLHTPIGRVARAVRCYRRAFDLGRASGDAVNHAQALRSCGQFLELLDLVSGRKADWVGAIACELRARELLRSSERGATTGSNDVLATRIAPRMNAAEFERVVAEASACPGDVVEATLDRLERSGD